jgi:hypothetical protein
MDMVLLLLDDLGKGFYAASSGFEKRFQELFPRFGVNQTERMLAVLEVP